MSVSYDEGRLIGSGFSKTFVAVRSEKRISSMGFEKGKPLNFRCACHGRSPAQNRSISRNERSDTLDPCIKSLWSSTVRIQLPSFPFGCYTNPCDTSMRPLSSYNPDAKRHTRAVLTVHAAPPGAARGVASQSWWEAPEAVSPLLQAGAEALDRTLPYRAAPRHASEDEEGDATHGRRAHSGWSPTTTSRKIPPTCLCSGAMSDHSDEAYEAFRRLLTERHVAIPPPSAPRLLFLGVGSPSRSYVPACC